MGYEYYDYYDYAEPALEAVAGFFAVFAAVFLFFALAIGIVSYVLTAVGLHGIGKRRGIHNSWLAWIPVASDWLLGSISDQYQYVARRKETNRRTVLLVMGIVTCILPTAQSIVTAMISFASASDSTAGSVGAMAGISLLLSMLTFGCGIAYAIFRYIALNDLFVACNPSSATVKLVLSIIFPITIPFFIIGSKNGDAGMPPRRTAAPITEIPPVNPDVAPVNESFFEDAPDEETNVPPYEDAPYEEPIKEDTQVDPFATEEAPFFYADNSNNSEEKPE